MVSEIIPLLFIAWRKKNIAFDRLILEVTSEEGSVEPVILEPGEVVTFAAFASEDATGIQTNQPVVSTPQPPEVIRVTRKPAGKVEKGYIWDSGFGLDKDACAFVITMGGIAGYKTKTAEKFDASGLLSSTNWSSGDGYIEPKCFTLWQGEPDLDTSQVLSRITEPKTVIPAAGNRVKFSTNNYLSLNLKETATGDYDKDLFGLGWEVSINMPGDLDNERITLVEFNTRALVHTTQHGQGNWLGDAQGKVPLIMRHLHNLRLPQIQVPHPIPLMEPYSHLIQQPGIIHRPPQNLLRIYMNYQGLDLMVPYPI